MKRLATLIAVLVTAGAVAAEAAGTSETGGAKRACNSINLGGPRVFYKHNMRCHRAKHYVRRLYKTDGRDEPRKFNCTSGSHFNKGADCRHKTKNKYFGWHPADKRMRAGSKPKVACWNKTFPSEPGNPHPQFYIAPRKCLIMKHGAEAFAEGAISATRLHWKTWGLRRAKATGKVGISTAGLLDAKIKLTKPRKSCGRLVFSKVRYRVENPHGDDFGGRFHPYTC